MPFALTKSLVVGTAGHIDHGKSALVKALTGTDPDRLKEERERGITIDLGFAHLTSGDVEIALVDVPGHERFVRNMLAGAGGIDAVLLVVAANESVMPQTREHFAICRLLGIDRGIVVLTKTDLVDREMIDLVALEVRDLVAGSFLAGAPIVAVSAKTGDGLDELTRAMAALHATASSRVRGAAVRLPVDRVFTVKGFGTVVTGTLVSGTLEADAIVQCLPDRRDVRVRGIQVHGASVAAATAPRRVAVNLGASSVDDFARGVSLVSAGSLTVTRRADAHIELLPGAKPLRHGARVHVHQGTSQMAARVAIAAVRGDRGGRWRAAEIGESAVAIPAGGEGFVRLRLAGPLALTRHDRVVLRAGSPTVTIGGGVVLDPEPPVSGLRRGSSLARFLTLADAEVSGLALWLAEAAERGMDRDAMTRRSGRDADAVADEIARFVKNGTVRQGAHVAFAAPTIARAEERIVAALAAHHRSDPASEGATRESLRELLTRNGGRDELFTVALDRLMAAKVVAGADRLALTSHRPLIDDADRRLGEAIARRLRESRLSPPAVATLAESEHVTAVDVQRTLHRLVKERQVVMLGGLYFDQGALDGLTRDLAAIRQAAGRGGTEVGVAWFKERYQISRKHAIPLLEYLDRARVTRRTGETRTLI